MICRTCSCIIDDCGVGHHPTCPDTDTAWLCGRGHTTQQPTCPACHDVAYARAQSLLRTWIAEDSALPRTVTIDAELLDELVEAFRNALNHEGDYFWADDLLARVKAAREGK